jgi:hypothetical protein
MLMINQEDVAEVHRVDDAPEEFRFLGDQLRAGGDALDEQRADDDGHGGVGREPEDNSGMNEDVAAALLAVSGAATPSMAPWPNRSGWRERRLSMA